MKKTDSVLSANQATLQRYGDLALLAVVVFVLFKLFGKLPFIANVARGYAKYANSLNDMVLGLFMLVLALFSHGLLLKLGVIHPKRRIASFWRYPSVLLSIYFVLLLAELSVGLLPEPFFNVPGGLMLAALGNPNTLLYIVFFTVIHSAHILVSFRKSKADKNKRESSKTPERQTNAQTQSNLQPNPNESTTDQEADLFSLTAREKDLLNWIEKEVPLEDERELRFGREIYVNRITKRFQQAETSQHLALCGDFGSGKSSVLNLVCCKLEDDESQNWLIVKINTWGRNPDSLGSYILEYMLNGASEHVDISALKPLPEHYRLALNAKGSWFSVFNQLLGSTNKTINEQFKRFDEVLNAINLKVLVVLEDLDRNSNTQEMVTATAALIEQLRSFSKFHFAVAIGYTANSADVISRVCDYREDLANEAYSDVFDDFLSIWVKRAKSSGMVLHFSYDALMATEGLEGKSDETIRDLGRPSFYDVMARVVQTPRVAKQICRRVDSVWKKGSLMGEIDLLDLLFLQTVRETSPNLYQTLKSHSRDKFALLFNSGGTPQSNVFKLLAESFSDYEPLGEPIGEGKNKQLEKEQTRIKEKYPAIELLTFVFPLVEPDNHGRIIEFQRIWKVDIGNIYFQRFEREYLKSDEIRDQRFLDEVLTHKQESDNLRIREVIDFKKFIESIQPSDFMRKILCDKEYFYKFKWFLRSPEFLGNDIEIWDWTPILLIDFLKFLELDLATGKVKSYLFDKSNIHGSYNNFISVATNFGNIQCKDFCEIYIYFSLSILKSHPEKLISVLRDLDGFTRIYKNIGKYKDQLDLIKINFLDGITALCDSTDILSVTKLREKLKDIIYEYGDFVRYKPDSENDELIISQKGLVFLEVLINYIENKKSCHLQVVVLLASVFVTSNGSVYEITHFDKVPLELQKRIMSVTLQFDKQAIKNSLDTENKEWLKGVIDFWFNHFEDE